MLIKSISKASFTYKTNFSSKFDETISTNLSNGFIQKSEDEKRFEQAIRKGKDRKRLLFFINIILEIIRIE
jgi:hypothetical protein